MRALVLDVEFDPSARVVQTLAALVAAGYTLRVSPFAPPDTVMVMHHGDRYALVSARTYAALVERVMRLAACAEQNPAAVAQFNAHVANRGLVVVELP